MTYNLFIYNFIYHEKTIFSNFALRIFEQWTHEIPKIDFEKKFKTQQAS